MPTAISRADFCKISLSGLVGAACRGEGAPATREAAAEPKPAGSAGKPGESATKKPGTAVGKRKLGATGEMVSMLGLGGAHIGKKDKLSDAESITLMRDAIEQGITFFDNCWDYNQGLSEERMGKALADGYRHRVFLMTKLDGRTAKAATEQLEQSLKRLRTDRIDLVQVHEIIRWEDPERCFAPDGIMGALSQAKKQGKLRYIGFTGHKDPKMHLKMLEVAQKAGFQFDTVQLPLNVMDAHFRSFEREVLPVLEKQGIGVLGMKAMGSGDILQSGVVSAKECLRYALSLPTSVVVTGIDSKEVLQQAVELGKNFVPLSPQERKALLARTEGAAKSGKHELFKTADKYDGTAKNPHWLVTAKL